VSGIVAKGRVVKALEYRHLPVLLCILAVAATLPALWAGLLNDDFCHWALLAGPDTVGEDLLATGIVPSGSGRLATALSEQFGPLDPRGNLTDLRNYGAIPWWTYEGLGVRFWRPLSSLTHWLDYRLFGDSPAMMHAHNLLWLGAVVLLVAMLYRRLTSPLWVAGLAAVLYAVDDFSYFPAMWIANRNTFVSLFFALLTLLAHHRWRREDSTAAGILAAVFLVGSLLSAEAGVATCAYLFAYAVALDKGKLARRAASLAPAVTVTVVWRLVYNALGHGATGGSFYSDPSREPLRYAWAILLRGPILTMRQWCGIPADIFSYMPDSAKLIFLPLIVAFVLAVLLGLLPLLRTSRLARFWVIGMHLAVLPACATMPMNRNLLFAGIGTCGLLALYIEGFVTRKSWVPTAPARLFWAKVLLTMFVLAHLPFALAARIGAPYVTGEIVEKVEETMAIETTGDITRQDLVVVNAPNPASFLYVPFSKARLDQPLPRAFRVLAPSFGALELVRPDSKSLLVRAESGSLLACNSGRKLDMHIVYLFKAVSEVRGAKHRMRPGQKVQLPRMSAEILETDSEGAPPAVLFRFEVPLEDESLSWLQWSWKKDRYLPFKPPPVAEQVRIRGPFD